MGEDLHKLWAPWRMEYIRRPKDDKNGCILCNKLTDLEEGLLIHKGETAFIVMNLYPYNNGHVLICPNEHISDFDELNPHVQVEVMTLTSRLMKFMKKEMNAEGFNMGANQGKAGGTGIDEHFHMHIVPRWVGDTNFMPIIGHTKVQVDGLKETCDLLKKAFI